MKIEEKYISKFDLNVFRKQIENEIMTFDIISGRPSKWLSC